MTTCGEALVKILESYDVEIVFGIPGVHTVELYRGLGESKLKHITPRHEQGAGFMADGYYRASGKIAACFIITGPGMTNIATAMGQALADSIPMLVISSVNRTEQLGMGEGYLHELPNQRNLVSGVARFSHTLMRADELPKILARAFTIFNCERPGPVHIEIPIDVITMEADHLDLTAYSIASAPGPCPVAISKSVELLSQAKRPIIAIGGGAVDTAQVLCSLAETIDAPVINTVNAKGVIPYSHPLAVGGSGSCPAIRRELEQADVVLAIGTEFSETDYDFFFVGDINLPGKLIRIDIDAVQLTRNVKVEIAICSQAKSALQAINKQLQSRKTNLGNGKGAERAKNLRQALRQSRDSRYQAFFETIQSTLPEVIIVGDSTQPVYYAWLHYETEYPGQYFQSASGYGTLGYAIPAAIGAKLAAPHNPVIGLIGDGAAQFTIGEIASVVELALPVIFIIWNNNGYGEIKRYMIDRDIPEIGVDIYTPDFIALAKAFGCHAVRPTNLNELASELIVAANQNQPTVIEIMQDHFADGYPNLQSGSII